VLLVFGNLRLENNKVCADLISADIVVKGTETPVVHLYPETKPAGYSGPDPIDPVDPAPSVNPKVQQIKKIVDGFLAMPNVPVAVNGALMRFQRDILPQIDKGAAGNQLQVVPAFLFQGVRQQP
ncbi:MAG: hypothetical protein LBN39_12500, partial [Planctomycetaceae bacterium]|nr:hypothetical protein [Planctomycetaceae bacterium]